MNHRKAREKKLGTLCGTLHLYHRDAIIRYLPVSGKKNLARLVGDILEEWVNTNEHIIPSVRPVEGQLSLLDQDKEVSIDLDIDVSNSSSFKTINTKIVPS